LIKGSEYRKEHAYKYGYEYGDELGGFHVSPLANSLQQRTIRTLPVLFELGSTRRMMLKRPINCICGKLSDRVLDGDWQLEKRSESCELVS
jgi:hypothetical protein